MIHSKGVHSWCTSVQSVLNQIVQARGWPVAVEVYVDVELEVELLIFF